MAEKVGKDREQQLSEQLRDLAAKLKAAKRDVAKATKKMEECQKEMQETHTTLNLMQGQFNVMYKEYADALMGDDAVLPTATTAKPL